jgi:hypothetical protein
MGAPAPALQLPLVQRIVVMERPAVPRHRRRRRDSLLPRLLFWLGLSIAAHVVLVAALNPYFAKRMLDARTRHLVPISLEVRTPEVKPPQDKDEEEPLPKGQIVDLPPPQEEERPLDADYLAEHERKVPEETRIEQFRVNPEVLAPTYSHEDKLQFEDLMDVGATDPSTGAKVGNDRFDPDRQGSLASLPSPFHLTNKDGLQKPVPASHTQQMLMGSPSNDLVDERLGTAVNLNTNEVLFANYINRIKRLVSFYWSQNLDNLPSSVRLVKPRYQTTVFVILDGNGALENIDVTTESGVPPLDNCVIEAFRIAGPFPNPPEQIVAKDGRVYLPDLGFTVQVGTARSPYVGVDPRQGVQFPGILKATY